MAKGRTAEPYDRRVAAGMELVETRLALAEKCALKDCQGGPQRFRRVMDLISFPLLRGVLGVR